MNKLIIFLFLYFLNKKSLKIYLCCWEFNIIIIIFMYFQQYFFVLKLKLNQRHYLTQFFCKLKLFKDNQVKMQVQVELFHINNKYYLYYQT